MVVLVSKEECKEIGGKFVKGTCIVEPYLAFLEKVEKLESEFKQLPEIAVLGAQYFPLMLTRPICMEKELLKAASTLNLNMLPNNAHINEEIDLLRKDMRLVEEDLKLMRLRGEKIVLGH